jgi:hypothetical protein
MTQCCRQRSLVRRPRKILCKLGGILFRHGMAMKLRHLHTGALPSGQRKRLRRRRAPNPSRARRPSLGQRRRSSFVTRACRAIPPRNGDVAKCRTDWYPYVPALPVHPGVRRPVARRFGSDCECATNVRYCNWTNRRHLGESGILRDKKQLDANTHQTLAKRQ